jgi:hypothetical protein
MDASRSRKGIGRREAIKRLMAGGGASAALPTLASATAQVPATTNAPPEPMAMGSALPPDPALSAKDWRPIFFDSHQSETLVVLSDLIIPETDTPGAKAAQVNRFIDLLLGAEAPEEQKRYLEALSWLDGYCLSHYSKPFTGLPPDDQTAVLTLLTSRNENPDLRRGLEHFRVLKDSIVQAYYTSEIGMLQELKYQTNPFQPNFPGCKHQPKYSGA